MLYREKCDACFYELDHIFLCIIIQYDDGFILQHNVTMMFYSRGYHLYGSTIFQKDFWGRASRSKNH